MTDFSVFLIIYYIYPQVKSDVCFGLRMLTFYARGLKVNSSVDNMLITWGHFDLGC